MMRLYFVAACAALIGLPLSAQAPAARPAPPVVRLTLADALARADSTVESVGIARAGLLRSQADWIRARSGYLPTLTGSATYTRTLKSQFSGFSSSSSSSDSFPAPVNCEHYHTNPALPIAQRIDSLERGLDCTANASPFDFSKLPFGRANTWNFGLAASQPLYNGRTSGQVVAAAAGRDRADAEFSAQRSQAVLDAASSYLDAQLADRLLQIAESTLAQSERSYEQTRLGRQVGNLAEFDLLRATVARDNQRPVVIQRRAARNQAMLHLRQLLHIPESQSLTLVTPLGDTVSAPLPSSVAAVATAGDTTLSSRAPVRQAAAGLRANEGLLGSARGGKWPTVTLSSAFAKIAFPDKVFSIGQMLTDWTVNVRMDVPIYSGGRSRADVMTAEAARDESALRLKQAQQVAERERSDVRQQLEAAAAMWDASRGTAEQAQRAYTIAEVRFQNGISTLTELSDSRLQLQQAEANRAQAARDLQVARLRSALLRDLPFGAGAAAASGPF
jgi:outer membrane protein TolC